MNILLIIYLTISVILGIVRMVNCCIELNAVEVKWYTIYPIIYHNTYRVADCINSIYSV